MKSRTISIYKVIEATKIEPALASASATSLAEAEKLLAERIAAGPKDSPSIRASALLREWFKCGSRPHAWDIRCTES